MAQATHARLLSLNQELLQLMDAQVEQIKVINQQRMAITRSRRSKSALPSTSGCSNGSTESVAATPSSSEGKSTPSLLNLPVDVFSCICDHLDRDIAYSLKLVCRGLSRSKLVDELLYREPFSHANVDNIGLNDWKYKPNGRERWNLFRKSINDSNRQLVQKIALSHWCTLADFRWIEQNLPGLTSLDLSSIKDFVWTPEETWTWKDLVDACPNLFSRIQDLEVCNWADYSAHSRIEYGYSFGDYRFKNKFRLTRRRDGSSIPKTILPACIHLRSLGLRGSSRWVAWNEWEVHARVCALSDSLDRYAPNLQTLRVYDIAPLMSLLLSETPAIAKISTVEIDLHNWMQEYRSNYREYPFFVHRMMPGTQHRNHEEAFDDGTYDLCERNHMDLGQRIVQDVGYPLGRILKQLNSIVGQTSPFKIKCGRSLQNMYMHPFHLISTRAPSRHHLDNPDVDVTYCSEVQDALHWLSRDCHWKPIFTWDTMMCDVFPENLGSNHLRPKAELLSRIKSMFEGLRSFGIPIRLSMGDRYACSSTGLDGTLLFGDFKHFVGEGDDRQQVIEPTHARFNLTGVAHLVDELTVQYAASMPTTSSWSKSDRSLTEGERELMKQEMTGWRKFWARYATMFTNLKKLTVVVPLEIFNDWGKSEHLAKLLGHEEWQMLETDVRRAAVDINDEFQFRHRFIAKHPRVKFIKRVFFRKNEGQMDFGMPELTEEQLNEQNIFPEEEMARWGISTSHPFWKPRAIPKKRKAESDTDEATSDKRQRFSVVGSNGDRMLQGLGYPYSNDTEDD